MILAVIVVLLAVTSLWIWLLYSHDIFEEWDGVLHYFSGLNFWESFVYKGWASHFWPPLQPLIISLGDPLVMGKIVALLSGLLVIIYSYLESLRNSLSRSESILVLIFVASSSTFLLAFSVVENHALETGFALLGVTFFFLSSESKKYLVVSAVFIALAGLVRYTSYIYALVLAFACLFRADKKGFYDAALFSIIFVLVSSVWWLPNYFINGSPLATWQYLNVGSRIYPGGSFEWWWHGQNDYKDLSDLIFRHPILFIENFIKNIAYGLVIVAKGLTSHWLTSFLLIATFIYCSITKRKYIFLFFKKNFLIVCAGTGYILLCSIAFVFHDALLPVMMMGTVFLGIFLLKYFRYGAALLLLASISNAALSYIDASTYLDYQDDRGGQLASLTEVNDVLIKDKASLISSIHPARAYYAETGWIMFPLYGVSSLCQVIDYSFSDKVYSYAPKHPVDLNRKSLSISHLVVGPSLKGMDHLIDPDSYLEVIKCENFSAVRIYNDDKGVSVYRVKY